MAYPLAWLILGAVLVILGGIWLRRARDRFVAEMRAKGDPLADGPKDKTFRRAFQAWLLDLGAPRQAGGDIVILIGAVGLMALGLYSFIGGAL